MAELSLTEREHMVAAARASLSTALHGAVLEMKPASLAGRAKENALSALAPVLDPMVEQTKSASGWLVLATSAVTMLVALGRSRGVSPVAKSPAEPEAGGDAPFGDLAYSADRKPKSKIRVGSLLGSAVLIGGGMAAGAYAGSRFPLSESEREQGAELGRQFSAMAKNLAKDHSHEIVSAAVHSLVPPRRAGMLLALLTTLSEHARSKARGV